MIKRQYDRYKPGYFKNFIDSFDPGDTVEEQLKEYNATIAKSKYRNGSRINVKWHDRELYIIFVLRHS